MKDKYTVPPEDTQSVIDFKQEFCQTMRHGNKVQVIKFEKIKVLVCYHAYALVIDLLLPRRFVVQFFRSFSPIALFKDSNIFVNEDVTGAKGTSSKTYFEFPFLLN